MKNTYEEWLKRIVYYEPQKEKSIKDIIEFIIQEDSVFYSFTKTREGYGYYNISLWVNEYVFGKNLARCLMDNCGCGTHDEDKEYTTLEDVREQIEECVYDYVALLEEKKSNQKMTLEEFANLINTSDDCEIEYNEIIAANGWENLTIDDTNICRCGDELLTFVDGYAMIRLN